MPKHIFVTGGVASSLGKGLTASSLGRLLKLRGLRVVMQKLDPYINVDPGTMNPYEHGEVFVTDDGGETDLDLGHYERFIDENLTQGVERHHGLDLHVGAGGRTPWRLPGQDRPGDPAHHRRDQAPHPRRRHRRCRRRHHRGRRHRRRHRDPPVPRGDPPVPQGRRTRQRLLHPRDARAVHRPLVRAEDEAHAALGDRAAQPRHPARHDRVPQRGADQRRPQAQDLEPQRRRRGGGDQRRRRPQHLRATADPPRRGPRHRGARRAAAGRSSDRPRVLGGGRPPRSRRPRSRCGSG